MIYQKGGGVVLIGHLFALQFFKLSVSKFLPQLFMGIATGISPLRCEMT
ncbi:MAG: hypothetical protein KDJ65_30240 [Anaerolineae bacterium]|nr:hypothetical protein [Anaerolineae bacterium]